MKMAGIHAHLGSQIFDVRGFVGCADKLCQLASVWKKKYGYETDILNVGGGFGIHYTDQDQPLPAEEFSPGHRQGSQEQVPGKRFEITGHLD